MGDPNREDVRIGLVGPCAAGKSTLATALKSRGFRVKHIAQEHSFVPNMWERLANPDILIFLDVSYPLTIQRRKLDWTEAEYQEQQHRLRHARQYADLYLLTDELTIEQVYNRVISFLNEAFQTRH